MQSKDLINGDGSMALRDSNAQNLKVGDWVRDILTNVVSKVELHKGGEVYPYRILNPIDGSYIASMMPDGRQFKNHKNPRFIKCDPPPKTIKKVVKIKGRIRYCLSTKSFIATSDIDWIDEREEGYYVGPLETEIEIEAPDENDI